MSLHENNRVLGLLLWSNDIQRCASGSPLHVTNEKRAPCRRTVRSWRCSWRTPSVNTCGPRPPGGSSEEPGGGGPGGSGPPESGAHPGHGPLDARGTRLPGSQREWAPEGGRERQTHRQRERESNRDRETGERESEGPALERTPRRLKSKNIIKVHNWSYDQLLLNTVDETLAPCLRGL